MTPPLSIITTTAGQADRIAAQAAAFARLQGEVAAEWLVAAGADRRAISSVLADTAPTGWTVEMLSIEDSTAAKAREAAATRAAGEVILHLDDDVVPMPGCLCAHLEAHRRHPGSVFVGNTHWVDGAAGNLFEHWLTHRRFQPPAWEGDACVGHDRLEPAHWSCPRGLLADSSFRVGIPFAGLETMELISRLAGDGIAVRFAADARAGVASVEAPSSHYKRWHRMGGAMRELRASSPGMGSELERRSRAEAARRPRWLLSGRRWLGLIDGPPEWAARSGHAFVCGIEGRPLPADITDEGYPSGT